MTLAAGYDSLGRMLDYPSGVEGIPADCDAVRAILRTKDIESPLEPFGRFVEASALARLQEEYVATFDFNPAVALYLGHHLCGDNWKKGAYLVRLDEDPRRHLQKR